MNRELRALIEHQLDAEDTAPEVLWPWLVLAACDGPDPLGALLAGTARPTRQAVTRGGVQAAAPRGGVFLQSIGIEGFRGIGTRHTLDLRPEPGLTLVVGRNGSGKSSFAEGLEFLLTRESFRWKQRPAEWREGWRNLHHQGQAWVAATFVIDHEGEVTVTHTWPAEAALADGETTVQPHGKPKAAFDSLGWTDALEAYRPFLSYNELGSMLDGGPSTLYDALSPALGLDDLVDVQRLLREARQERERAARAAKQTAADLARRVQALASETGDNRASRCATILGAKTWDLSEIESAVTNASGPDAATTLLQRAAALTAPNVERATQAAERLRRVAATLAQLGQSAAARAADTVVILDRALHFHQRFGDGDCPVCASPDRLNAAWRPGAEDAVRRLRSEANAFEAARTELEQARASARAFLEPPPTWLTDLAAVGVTGADDLQARWLTWARGRDLADAESLASHLLNETPPFAQAVERLVSTASEAWQSRQDRWQPLALALAEWLPGARKAQAGASEIKELKAAEDWVKEASERIRNERFAPIGTQACDIWRRLRLQSNVDLRAVALESSGNRRRVRMEVTVDDIEGAALGVMSQGELNSLALSLFLPRAALPDTPFRFIVIDDPVQSMDPSRVEGLARVLDDVAKRRQVVVFTHDDRLSEAVRHLQIKAHVVKVTRRTKSRVETAIACGPIESSLDDAKALALTENLPSEVARRVIPGFCRNAVEAACVETIRRRRRAKGVPIEDVDRELDAAQKLYPLAALTFFDDAKRTNDVLPRLNQLGAWAGDTFLACNKGAHEGYSGDVRALVENSKRLAESLRKVKSP